MTSLIFSQLSYAIIGAAMEVHNVLGPGFLEAVYQAAMERELTLRGLPFITQIRLPVHYKGLLVGDYVADILVDNNVIVELKAVSGLTPAHEAQALNYLAATGKQLALLLNCGKQTLEFKRIVR